MKKILFINGSPRGTKSNSLQILKDIALVLKEENGIQEKPDILTLSRKIPKDPQLVLEKMSNQDILIFSLPLYVDALPGHLTWWLDQFFSYLAKANTVKTIRVYGIVNCGFPEAEQNADALEILKIFCMKTGLNWRFGVGIGMGEPYRGMAGIPLKSGFKKDIYKAYKTIASDILSESNEGHKHLFVKVRFPGFLYKIMGTLGWKKQIRKNGLKPRDLRARPLLEP